MHVQMDLVAHARCTAVRREFRPGSASLHSSSGFSGTTTSSYQLSRSSSSACPGGVFEDEQERREQVPLVEACPIPVSQSERSLRKCRNGATTAMDEGLPSGPLDRTS
jgi:2-methylisocitrate lyase-like PEP mutase family enzyme